MERGQISVRKEDCRPMRPKVRPRNPRGSPNRSERSPRTRGAQRAKAAFSRSTWVATALRGGARRKAVRGRHRAVEVRDARLQPQRLQAELAQRRRQLFEQIGVAGDVLLGEADPVLLGQGLRGGHLALVDRALEQQPGGDLHQPRRQPHALGRIGEGDGARQALRFLRARGRRDRRPLPRPGPCPP